ncbi:unnamed protein product [Rodentolepis nana]|uniref:Ovate family protein n=1 Tax=Rodentolepis nana TaxID=102285 RepID=A0A0R3TXA8_RODNA|nr:unnamed protein product [Rodentolepis nana]
MAIRKIALVRAKHNVFRSSSGMLEKSNVFRSSSGMLEECNGQKDPNTENPTNLMDFAIFTIMEANISDAKLKYYQFPGYTLYKST